MGTEIKNRFGEFIPCYQFGYGNLLELAYEYGWKPMGTYLNGEKFYPEGVHWIECYTSNDFQEILQEDALNIAKALTTALKDEDLYKEIKSDLGLQNYIKDFIKFCEGGPFWIS
jgi:hypothetical protein